MEQMKGVDAIQNECLVEILVSLVVFFQKIEKNSKLIGVTSA
jgi:hypothetical protein